MQVLGGYIPAKPTNKPGALPPPGAWALGNSWQFPGSQLCPVRIQLQLAPEAPTHLCEACWPRGHHSEVGLGAFPPGVRIQILGRRLQLIRAR